MKTITIVFLLCLVTQVLQTNGLIQLKNSLASSDSPLLMKILELVDAATSDEHLLQVTLKLLRSLCACMQETLKAKEDYFNISKHSLETNEFSGTEGKVFDLYRNIYNNTCFNLRQELTNRTQKFIFDEEFALLNHTNCGKDENNEIDDKRGDSEKSQAVKHSIPSRLEQVLYKALIETKDLHDYRLRKYNLFKGTQTKSALQHILIVILTLHPELQEVSSRKNNIDENELNNTLYKKSSIDVDIIDTEHDQQYKEKDESIKSENLSDCNLKSLYKFLSASDRNNLTKVFKYIRKRETIKIYIEVNLGQNHTDLINICCENGTTIPLCNKDFINDPQPNFLGDSYINTITRIKSLVNQYENKLNDSHYNISTTTDEDEKKEENIVIESTTKQSFTNADRPDHNDSHKTVTSSDESSKFGEVTQAIVLLNDFVTKQTTKYYLQTDQPASDKPSTDFVKKDDRQQASTTTNLINTVTTIETKNQEEKYQNKSTSSLQLNESNTVAYIAKNVSENEVETTPRLKTEKSSYKGEKIASLGVTLPMFQEKHKFEEELQQTTDMEHLVNNNLTINFYSTDNYVNTELCTVDVLQTTTKVNRVTSSTESPTVTKHEKLPKLTPPPLITKKTLIPGLRVTQNGENNFKTYLIGQHNTKVSDNRSTTTTSTAKSTDKTLHYSLRPHKVSFKINYTFFKDSQANELPKEHFTTDHRMTQNTLSIEGKNAKKISKYTTTEPISTSTKNPMFINTVHCGKQAVGKKQSIPKELIPLNFTDVTKMYTKSELKKKIIKSSALEKDKPGVGNELPNRMTTKKYAKWTKNENEFVQNQIFHNRKVTKTNANKTSTSKSPESTNISVTTNPTLLETTITTTNLNIKTDMTAESLTTLSSLDLSRVHNESIDDNMTDFDTIYRLPKVSHVTIEEPNVHIVQKIRTNVTKNEITEISPTETTCNQTTEDLKKADNDINYEILDNFIGDGKTSSNNTNAGIKTNSYLTTGLPVNAEDATFIIEHSVPTILSKIITANELILKSTDTVLSKVTTNQTEPKNKKIKFSEEGKGGVVNSLPNEITTETYYAKWTEDVNEFGENIIFDPPKDTKINASHPTSKCPDTKNILDTTNPIFQEKTMITTTQNIETNTTPELLTTQSLLDSSGINNQSIHDDKDFNNIDKITKVEPMSTGVSHVTIEGPFVHTVQKFRKNLTNNDITEITPTETTLHQPTEDVFKVNNDKSSEIHHNFIDEAKSRIKYTNAGTETSSYTTTGLFLNTEETTVVVEDSVPTILLSNEAIIKTTDAVSSEMTTDRTETKNKKIKTNALETEAGFVNPILNEIPTQEFGKWTENKNEFGQNFIFNVSKVTKTNENIIISNSKSETKNISDTTNILHTTPESLKILATFDSSYLYHHDKGTKVEPINKVIAHVTIEDKSSSNYTKVGAKTSNHPTAGLLVNTGETTVIIEDPFPTISLKNITDNELTIKKTEETDAVFSEMTTDLYKEESNNIMTIFKNITAHKNVASTESILKSEYVHIYSPHPLLKDILDKQKHQSAQFLLTEIITEPNTETALEGKPLIPTSTYNKHSVTTTVPEFTTTSQNITNTEGFGNSFTVSGVKQTYYDTTEINFVDYDYGPTNYILMPVSEVQQSKKTSKLLTESLVTKTNDSITIPNTANLTENDDLEITSIFEVTTKLANKSLTSKISEVTNLTSKIPFINQYETEVILGFDNTLEITTDSEKEGLSDEPLKKEQENDLNALAREESVVNTLADKRVSEITEPVELFTLKQNLSLNINTNNECVPKVVFDVSNILPSQNRSSTTESPSSHNLTSTKTTRIKISEFNLEHITTKANSLADDLWGKHNGTIEQTEINTPTEILPSRSSSYTTDYTFTDSFYSPKHYTTELSKTVVEEITTSVIAKKYYQTDESLTVPTSTVALESQTESVTHATIKTKDMETNTISVPQKKYHENAFTDATATIQLMPSSTFTETKTRNTTRYDETDYFENDGTTLSQGKIKNKSNTDYIKLNEENTATSSFNIEKYSHKIISKAAALITKTENISTLKILNATLSSSQIPTYRDYVKNLITTVSEPAIINFKNKTDVGRTKEATLFTTELVTPAFIVSTPVSSTDIMQNTTANMELTIPDMVTKQILENPSMETTQNAFTEAFDTSQLDARSDVTFTGTIFRANEGTKTEDFSEFNVNLKSQVTDFVSKPINNSYKIFQEETESGTESFSYKPYRIETTFVNKPFTSYMPESTALSTKIPKSISSFTKADKDYIEKAKTISETKLKRKIKLKKPIAFELNIRVGVEANKDGIKFSILDEKETALYNKSESRAPTSNYCNSNRSGDNIGGTSINSDKHSNEIENNTSTSFKSKEIVLKNMTLNRRSNQVNIEDLSRISEILNKLSWSPPTMKKKSTQKKKTRKSSYTKINEEIQKIQRNTTSFNTSTTPITKNFTIIKHESKRPGSLTEKLAMNKIKSIYKEHFEKIKESLNYSKNGNTSASDVLKKIFQSLSSPVKKVIGNSKLNISGANNTLYKYENQEDLKAGFAFFRAINDSAESTPRLNKNAISKTSKKLINKKIDILLKKLLKGKKLSKHKLQKLKKKILKNLTNKKIVTNVHKLHDTVKKKKNVNMTTDRVTLTTTYNFTTEEASSVIGTQNVEAFTASGLINENRTTEINTTYSKENTTKGNDNQMTEKEIFNTTGEDMLYGARRLFGTRNNNRLVAHQVKRGLFKLKPEKANQNTPTKKNISFNKNVTANTSSEVAPLITEGFLGLLQVLNEIDEDLSKHENKSNNESYVTESSIILNASDVLTKTEFTKGMQSVLDSVNDLIEELNEDSIQENDTKPSSYVGVNSTANITNTRKSNYYISLNEIHSANTTTITNSVSKKNTTRHGKSEEIITEPNQTTISFSATDTTHLLETYFENSIQNELTSDNEVLKYTVPMTTIKTVTFNKSEFPSDVTAAAVTYPLTSSLATITKAPTQINEPSDNIKQTVPEDTINIHDMKNYFSDNNIFVKIPDKSLKSNENNAENLKELTTSKPQMLQISKTLLPPKGTEQSFTTVYQTFTEHNEIKKYFKRIQTTTDIPSTSTTIKNVEEGISSSPRSFDAFTTYYPESFLETSKQKQIDSMIEPIFLGLDHLTIPTDTEVKKINMNMKNNNTSKEDLLKLVSYQPLVNKRMNQVTEKNKINSNINPNATQNKLTVIDNQFAKVSSDVSIHGDNSSSTQLLEANNTQLNVINKSVNVNDKLEPLVSNIQNRSNKSQDKTSRNNTKQNLLKKVQDGEKNASVITKLNYVNRTTINLKPEVQKVFLISRNKEKIRNDMEYGQFKGKKSIEIYTSRLSKPNNLLTTVTAVTKSIKYNTYRPISTEELELLKLFSDPTFIQKQDDVKSYLQLLALNHSSSAKRNGSYSILPKHNIILRPTKLPEFHTIIQTENKEHGDEGLHLEMNRNQTIDFFKIPHLSEINRISHPLLEININSPQIRTNGASPPMIEINGNPLPIEINRNSVPMDINRNSAPVDINRKLEQTDMDRNLMPMDINRNPVPMDFMQNPMPMNINKNSVPVDINRNPVPMDINRNSAPVYINSNPLQIDMDRNPMPMDIYKDSVPIDINRNPVPMKANRISAPIEMYRNSLSTNNNRNSELVDKNSNLVPMDINRNLVPMDMNRNPVLMDMNKIPVPIDINRNPISIKMNRNLAPMEINRNPAPMDIIRNSVPVEINRNSVQIDMNKNTMPIDINRNPVSMDINRNSVQTAMNRNLIPIEMDTNSTPMEINRNLVPIEMSRNSGPIEINRSSAPMVMNRNSVPIEVNRNSSPMEINRNPVPMDINRNSVPVNINRNLVKIDMNRNSVPIDMNGYLVPMDINKNPVSIDMKKNSTPTDINGYRVPMDINNNPVSTDIKKKSTQTEMNRSPAPIEMNRNSVKMEMNSPPIEINRNSVQMEMNSPLIEMKRNSTPMKPNRNSAPMETNRNSVPMDVNRNAGAIAMNRNPDPVEGNRNLSPININSNSVLMDMNSVPTYMNKNLAATEMNRNSIPKETNRNPPPIEMNLSPTEMNRNYVLSAIRRNSVEANINFVPMETNRNAVPKVININPVPIDSNKNSVLMINNIVSVTTGTDLPSVPIENEKISVPTDSNRNQVLMNMNTNLSPIDTNRNSLPTVFDRNVALSDSNRNLVPMETNRNAVPEVININPVPTDSYKNSVVMVNNRVSVTTGTDLTSVPIENEKISVPTDSNRNPVLMNMNTNLSPIDTNRNSLPTVFDRNVALSESNRNLMSIETNTNLVPMKVNTNTVTMDITQNIIPNDTVTSTVSLKINKSWKINKFKTNSVPVPHKKYRNLLPEDTNNNSVQMEINRNSSQTVGINSNKPTMRNLNTNSPFVLNPSTNTDNSSNLPSMQNYNRTYNRKLPSSAGKNRKEFLDNKNVPSINNSTWISASMFNNNGQLRLNNNSNIPQIIYKNQNLPPTTDAYKTMSSMVDKNMNAPSVIGHNKKSSIVTMKRRNGPARHSTQNSRSIETNKKSPPMKTYLIPITTGIKKSEVFVAAKKKIIPMKEIKRKPLLTFDNNKKPLSMVGKNRKAYGSLEINSKAHSKIIMKSYKKNSSQKKILLDSFDKRNPYTAKIKETKTQKKYFKTEMKQMKIGTRRKTVMTMNTQDFLSQHQTPRSFFQTNTKPYLRFLKPERSVKKYILKPKFDSIDRAVKRLEHKPKPRPVFMKKNIFQRNLISHRQLMGRMTKKETVNNVLDMPIRQSTFKPKFFKDSEDGMSYMFTDYMRITRRPVHYDMARVPKVANFFGDSYSPSPSYRRSNIEQSTTVATRQPRRGRTIFFLSPTGANGDYY